MVVSDFDEPPFEVWPEHVQAVKVFVALGTQWAVGTAGVIGLRYESLAEVWKTVGVRKRDRPRVFEDLRVLESEALAQMRENGNQK